MSALTFLRAVLPLAWILGRVDAYDMTPLTVNGSLLEKRSEMDAIKEALDFEVERSFTFMPSEGTLKFEDAIDLCEALEAQKDTVQDVSQSTIMYFVPVIPDSDEPPQFQVPCFGWIRKTCAGTPRPPFDYRCHFWVPFLINYGGCSNNNVRRRRKKRLTPYIDSIVIGGHEAATLCGTMAYGFADGVQNLQKLALPTNEALELRCVNFKLSPEGGWLKKRLSEEACAKQNKGRPNGYGEVAGQSDDDYSDIIRCEARGTLVDCMFLEPILEGSSAM